MKKNLFLLLAASLFFVGCVSAPQATSTATVAKAKAETSESRMISFTVFLSLETENSENCNAQIEAIVARMGGFMTKTGTQASVIRVPSEKLKDFIEEMKKIGTIVRKEINGIDITDAYNDIKLKLESLQKLREKYLALLDKAKDVQDLLAIEKELERINLEIESLEGRKLEAEKKVEYATVYIDFRKKVNPGPVGWIFVGLFSIVKWLFVWE